MVTNADEEVGLRRLVGWSEICESICVENGLEGTSKPSYFFSTLMLGRLVGKLECRASRRSAK